MRAFPKSSRGFSMIELMVAMVIGLIGMIIILQVFEVSEGIKRTTTSGGDAQQNGAIAAYVLERDIRNSGMGFNDTGFAGCSIIGYDGSLGNPNLPAAGVTMLLVPVRITSGLNSNVPDQITVIYGSQTHVSSGSQLSQNMNNPTDALRVTSVYGFSPGDLIVVMETPPPVPPAKPCSLMEITAINPDDQTLSHDSGNYTYTPPSGSPITVPSRFNKPGGLGISYQGGGATQKTYIYNLGAALQGSQTMPVYSSYGIDYTINKNTLTVTSLFSTGTPPAVADNIVHLRALYGVDDGSNNGTVTNTVYKQGDGIVDSWIDGTAFPNWSWVIAVKVAVLARSALKEKPSAGPSAPCDTTTAEPTWTGSAWSGNPWNLKTRLDVSKSPDGTANPDWQCYRYRVFEATIPVRNWLWNFSNPIN